MALSGREPAICTFCCARALRCQLPRSNFVPLAISPSDAFRLCCRLMRPFGTISALMPRGRAGLRVCNRLHTPHVLCFRFALRATSLIVMPIAVSPSGFDVVGWSGHPVGYDQSLFVSCPLEMKI